MNDRVLEGRYWPWMTAALAASTCISVLLHGGPILRGDWPVWWSICHSMQSEIVPQQRWLWGVLWAEGDGGLVLGTTYSLAIIVPWMLSYVVSVTAAQKFLLLASYELVALSAYWVARMIGCPRQVAALAGLFVLLQSMDMINSGAWYDLASVGLALLFLVGLLRFLERPAVGRWIFACLMLTLAIYGHPLGAILGCACGSGAFAYELANRSRQGRDGRLVALLLIAAAGLLLAAPQLLSLAEKAMAPATHGFAPTPRLYRPKPLDLVRLCGILFSIPTITSMWHRSRLTSYIFFAGLLGVAAIYLKVPAWLPRGTPLRGFLIEFDFRFGKPLDILLTLLVAASAARLIESPCDRGRGGWAAPAGMLALGLVAPLLFLAAPKVTLGKLEYADQFKSLCSWLSANAGSGEARVYVEDTNVTSRPLLLDEPGTFLYGMMPKTHLFGLTPAMAGVQQVNGFWGSFNPLHARYTVGMGEGFFRLPPEEFRERLRLLNCGYVVAFTEDIRARLSGLGFMEPAATFDPFQVFKVKGFVPCWAWSGDFGEPLKVVRGSSLEYQLDTAGIRDGSATVSLAYAHRWHAYAGGTRLPIEPAQGLIRIALPDPAPERVVLRYEINRRPPAMGLVAGVLCLLMGVSWSAWLSRAAPPRTGDEEGAAIGREWAH